ncbi:hydrogenase maturation nickel metallochaperone HypA [Candidatus Chlorohelix sp.]|uniref:hydrogenase maturation nickel metallochaperone HypA/HybF n=1 Tax=Candidatus Chlorohelix sp. TaxID=3139201 RepID=UPI0030642D66
MHELSIAYNLVEVAEKAAIEAKAIRVQAVYLRLGMLTGIVKDALLFGYDVAVQGTLLEGSQLVVEELPVIVYCAVCKTETILPDIQHFRCSLCNTPTGDIRQGKELELASLEVVDEAPDS